MRGGVLRSVLGAVSERYKLKQGRYKFSIAATVAGVTGPTAARKVKVVRTK
jgi:hypothetical protein